MAANDVYINPGTEITPTISAGTGVAFGAGQKSDAIALAALYATARPYDYRWTCHAKWQNPALVGESLDLYFAEANATGLYDGGVTAVDEEFTDEDGLKNLKYFGNVAVTNETEEQEVSSGEVSLTSHSAVLVVWNGSAGGDLAVDGFEFKMIPVPMQVQTS